MEEIRNNELAISYHFQNCHPVCLHESPPPFQVRLAGLLTTTGKPTPALCMADKKTGMQLEALEWSQQSAALKLCHIGQVVISEANFLRKFQQAPKGTYPFGAPKYRYERISCINRWLRVWGKFQGSVGISSDFFVRVFN